MDPNVTAYIDNLDQDWQVEVCTRLRHIVHQAIPEVEERIHYHRPHFPQHGRDTCAMGTTQRWVSVTIFHATTLAAPAEALVLGGSAH